ATPARVERARVGLRLRRGFERGGGLRPLPPREDRPSVRPRVHRDRTGRRVPCACRRRPMSMPLRLRLTLVFALGMALVLSGFGAFVYVRVGRGRLATVDLGLRARVQPLPDQVQPPAAGWIVIGSALGPVERMRQEAAAISASEPERRLPVPSSGDELARLGTTLNAMLDRLQDALERERRFVDDASHELRTPLSILKMELDLALARARTPEELESALTNAAEETDRLVRLAQDLLVLARLEGGRVLVHRAEV